jgi:hypothetical protein
MYVCIEKVPLAVGLHLRLKDMKVLCHNVTGHMLNMTNQCCKAKKSCLWNLQHTTATLHTRYNLLSTVKHGYSMVYLT